MKKAEQITLKNVPSKNQMSETFINNVFLALSGGLQDAYTYNTRDGVFSNAQTGNVVLMSQGIMAGEWKEAVRYMIPLLAFALGVFVTERIQYKHKYDEKIHWRQRMELLEVLILFLVGFIPVKWNMFATVLVSFTCAVQVQAFRTVGGYSYASTMCIGNLRSGVNALSMYFREKKSAQLEQCCYYFGIILFFAVGAGIGGNLSLKYGIGVIWISCVLLFISFFIMHNRNKGVNL